jgi:hypothetical protein
LLELKARLLASTLIAYFLKVFFRPRRSGLVLDCHRRRSIDNLEQVVAGVRGWRSDREDEPARKAPDVPGRKRRTNVADPG